jgi:hypothetical protein
MERTIRMFVQESLIESIQCPNPECSETLSLEYKPDGYRRITSDVECSSCGDIAHIIIEYRGHLSDDMKEYLMDIRYNTGDSQ